MSNQSQNKIQVHYIYSTDTIISFKKQMEEILSFQMTPYFAFGPEAKSSLIAEFCRENRFNHIKNPILEAIEGLFDRNSIIEGTVELFKDFEQHRPQAEVLFVGNEFSEEQTKIKREYMMIGKCIQVSTLDYEQFRKALFPNLVLFYGPNQKQNLAAAQSFASSYKYCQVALPPDPNVLIKEFKKTVNYAISGCYHDPKQLQILDQYFNIKIVHFRYSRIEVKGMSQFFDSEFNLIPFLKQQPYYVPVKGNDEPIKIMDDIARGISPQLIYAKCDNMDKTNYLNQYVQSHESEALLLHIDRISEVLRRKGLRVSNDPFDRIKLLNEIVYRHFWVKSVFVVDFPHLLNDLINLENSNRKFSRFVDLVNSDSLCFCENFNADMYFLENQKRIAPASLETPLENYLQQSVKYWTILGAAGSGKTTVARHLQAKFDFKFIDYEQYIGPLKEKLLGPDDGQEVPLKKILSHFQNLINENKSNTYVIDGLPFEGKDLQEWVRVVGVPCVIILKVDEKESIKRCRKKAESDVNAEITEEDAAKAKQSEAKAAKVLQVISECDPKFQVHEIDYNQPVLPSEAKINEIFSKKVFLVQNHYSLAFHNIAQKHDMGLINLAFKDLKSSAEIARRIKAKNIFLCNYKQTEEKLISEDLAWIEENVGSIVYLAIWDEESTEAKEEALELQRPKVEEKPKVEAEGEEKPPEQQGEKPSNAFDIYSYQWSRTGKPKNLSQWFLKSKKGVEKIQCSKNDREIFNQWSEVASRLQNSQHVYHVFK